MIQAPRLLAMGFVSPLWLWALGAVAIPLAIHLWRRQAPRIERWAAMQFLRAAVEQHSRRLRIESLLLLLVRCVILVLLALAIAQPILDSGVIVTSQSPRIHKILVLDGSLSMSAKSGTESRFDRARQLARRIVQQSSAGDTFNLCRIGNASSPVIIRRPAHDPADVIREIDRLPLLDDEGDVAGALRQVSDLLIETPADQRTEIYILSDFQTTNWSSETPTQDAQLRQAMKDLATRAQLYLVSTGNPGTTNISLKSLQVPEMVALLGRPMRVEMEIVSHALVEETRSVEILVDNIVRATQNVTLPPGTEQKLTSSVQVPDAGQSVVLEARVGPDAITSDNQIRRVVASRKSLNVLLVDGHPAESIGESATGFVQLAVAPPLTAESVAASRGGFFETTTCSVAELSQMEMTRYDCILLSDVSGLSPSDLERLTAFATAGGGLVLGLGDHIDREEFQQTLGATLFPAEIQEFVDHASEPVSFETSDLDHPVLEPFRGRTDSGLATAPISRYALIKLRTEGNWQVILPYTTGNPAIVERSVGRGRVILVTTSLNDSWGHWVLWPSYVPLMNRLLKHSIEGRLRSDPLTVGTSIRAVYPQPVMGTFQLPSARTVDALVENEGTETALFWPDTGTAGVYQMTVGMPVNQRIPFAVNTHPRESDMRCLTLETLRRGPLTGTPFEWVTDIGQITREPTTQTQGRTTLSRPLLWGVIGLLFAELLLVWRFRWGVAALAGIGLCSGLLWWNA